MLLPFEEDKPLTTLRIRSREICREGPVYAG
jgi:hypothetical protein